MGIEGTLMDLANVPLLIKLPGQKDSVIDDSDVRTVDILPSIADVLGIDTNWQFDGHSVFDSLSAARGEKSIIIKQGANLSRVALDASATSRRDAVALSKIALFGTGEDGGDIFRIGPRAKLVGGPLNVFQGTSSGAPSDMTVELYQPRVYDEIDLEDSFLPTFITGKLHWNLTSDNRTHFLGAPKARGPSSTSGGIGKKLDSAKLRQNSAVPPCLVFEKWMTQSYRRLCTCHQGTDCGSAPD